jgi:hypothetical protein
MTTKTYDLPEVSGHKIAAATVALTDGGYVMGNVFDPQGQDITDEVEYASEVHVPRDPPRKPGDSEASRLTGSWAIYKDQTYLEPTVVVHVFDGGHEDGDVLIWHIGPEGAVPVVYDRGVPVSGIRNGDLIPYEGPPLPRP